MIMQPIYHKHKAYQDRNKRARTCRVACAFTNRLTAPAKTIIIVMAIIMAMIIRGIWSVRPIAVSIESKSALPLRLRYGT
jgi:hypothetical protein